MSHRPVVFVCVCSEGMGHATRSWPLVDALQRRGYDVRVFCGGRVAQYLRARGANVREIFHILLSYEDNKMLIGKSFLDQLPKIPGGVVDYFGMLWRMWTQKPVAVISDFEAIGGWTAWWSGTPLIVVGNNNLIRYAQVPAPRNDAERRDEAAVQRATWWNMPVIDRNLLTSFYTPPLRPGVDVTRVQYAPCVARAEVLARRDRTSSDGPILVYQTTSTNRDLRGTLAQAARRAGLRFAVYGMGTNDDRSVDDADGAVQYRAFSEDGFLDDMAASPFVIVNGGHSTIVEALALGKPILAEPVKRQYEQVLNGRGLEAMGVGRGVAQLTVDEIVSFAQQAPSMRERAQQARGVVDNDGFFMLVEQALHALSPSRALPPRGTVVALPAEGRAQG